MAAEERSRGRKPHKGTRPDKQNEPADDSWGDVIRGDVGAHASHVAIGKGIHTSMHENQAHGDITHVEGDDRSGGDAGEPIAALAAQSEARLFDEQRNYLEVRQQAQQAALVAQIAAEVGFVLVAGAAVLYGLGYTTMGVVTGILSALSQAFAAFFAGQVKTNNDRLERYHAGLMEAQRWDAAMALIARMEEGPAKERAVALLFEGLLRR